MKVKQEITVVHFIPKTELDEAEDPIVRIQYEMDQVRREIYNDYPGYSVDYISADPEPKYDPEHEIEGVKVTGVANRFVEEEEEVELYRRL